MGSPQIKIKVDQDAIAYFESCLSSDTLAQSQELETWLHHLELVISDDTDSTRIRWAWTYCKGTTDLIINSVIWGESFVVPIIVQISSIIYKRNPKAWSDSTRFPPQNRRVCIPGSEGILYRNRRSGRFNQTCFSQQAPAIFAWVISIVQWLATAWTNKLSRASRAPRETRRPIPVASTQLPEARRACQLVGIAGALLDTLEGRDLNVIVSHVKLCYDLRLVPVTMHGGIVQRVRK